MSSYLHRLALSVLQPGRAIQPILGSIYSPSKSAAGQMDVGMDGGRSAASGLRIELEPTRDQGTDDRPEKTSMRPDSSIQKFHEIAAPPSTALSSGTIGQESINASAAEPTEKPIVVASAQTQAQAMSGDPASLRESARLPIAGARPALPTRVDLRPSLARDFGDQGIFGKEFQKLADSPSAASVAANTRSEPVPRAALPPPLSDTSNERVIPQSIRPLASLPARSGHPAKHQSVKAPTVETQEDSLMTPGPTGKEAALKQKATRLEVEQSFLKPVMAADSRMQAAFSPSPLNTSALGRQKQRAESNRAEPARHEPDEIQIHIGRIEVLAAAPTRPASPKRRCKAASLGEYLRQRDGRAA